MHRLASAREAVAQPKYATWTEIQYTKLFLTLINRNNLPDYKERVIWQRKYENVLRVRPGPIYTCDERGPYK